MLAKIYKPSRSAMQSGVAKTREWVLEFVPADAKVIDPLMGWTGSDDMNSQVRLRFDSREAAVAYAERNHIPFECSSRNSAAISCARTATGTISPPCAGPRGRTERRRTPGPVAQPDRAPTF